jgi:small subunit ribosomal protein S16
VIVQDSRFSPKRGRVVSYLGSYDPHTKAAVIDSEKAAQYLGNGAQPSDRVARLFKKEGIKLPDWVKLDEPKKRSIRNPEKRRSTAPPAPKEEAPAAQQPAESTEPETAPETEAAVETPAEAETPETTAAEEPADAEEAPETETPAPDEKAEEKPTQS